MKKKKKKKSRPHQVRCCVPNWQKLNKLLRYLSNGSTRALSELPRHFKGTHQEMCADEYCPVSALTLANATIDIHAAGVRLGRNELEGRKEGRTKGLNAEPKTTLYVRGNQ